MVHTTLNCKILVRIFNCHQLPALDLIFKIKWQPVSLCLDKALLLVNLSLKLVILVNIMSLDKSLHRLLKGSGLMHILGELGIVFICHHEALLLCEV